MKSIWEWSKFPSLCFNVLGVIPGYWISGYYPRSYQCLAEPKSYLPSSWIHIVSAFFAIVVFVLEDRFLLCLPEVIPHPHEKCINPWFTCELFISEWMNLILFQGHANKVKPSAIWSSALNCGQPGLTVEPWPDRYSLSNCTAGYNRLLSKQICAFLYCTHHISVLHVNNIIFISQCLMCLKRE